MPTHLKHYKQTETSELFLGPCSQTDSEQTCLYKKTRIAWSRSGTHDPIQAEYQLLKQLNHPLFIQPEGVTAIQGEAYLVYPFFDGKPLSDWIGPPMDLADFWPLACALVEGLMALETLDWVHGQLTPDHLLYDSRKKQLKLLGLGHSVRQTTQPSPVSTLAENVAFLAPEASGQLTTAVSSASDRYSLGVWLYALLTGQPPFLDQSAESLWHQHVTRPVPEAHTVRSAIPVGLSRLLSKLLQKDPVDRYASARLVLRDLRQLSHWHQTGEVNRLAMFYPDEGLSDPLRPSSSGRAMTDTVDRSAQEAQIIRFLKETDRSESEVPPCQLLRLHGASGVGKSSMLAQTLTQSGVGHSDAFVLTLKCDQYDEQSVFEGLYQGLNHWVRRLEGLPDALFDTWKARLADHFQAHASLMVSLLPDLTLVWPDLSAVPMPGESGLGQAPSQAMRESETVMHLMSRFVDQFADPDKPVILVLDDVQWAHARFFDWLSRLIIEVKGLKLIMAYRDNEVGPDHPATHFWDKAQRSGCSLENVALGNLSEQALQHWVAQRLPEWGASSREELAQILHAKTLSNPFFLGQLFQVWQTTCALTGTEDDAAQQNAMGQLKKLSVADNVVEFLVERFQHFSVAAQRFLAIAACASRQNCFSFALVASVYDEAMPVESVLEPLIDEGWVWPLESSAQDDCGMHYQFAHDRIVQAVLSVWASDVLAQWHWRLGMNFAKTVGLDAPQEAQADAASLLQVSSATGEQLFTLLHHLNACVPFLGQWATGSQQKWLFQLQLDASQSARERGEFERAYEYAVYASAVIQLDWALSDHIRLARTRAECAHFTQRYEEAEGFYREALAQMEDAFSKAEVCEWLVKLYTDQSRFQDAYETGLIGAQWLGVTLPGAFSPAAFVSQWSALRRALRPHTMEALLHYRPATENRDRLRIRLLSAMLKVAYQLNPKLCVLLSMRLLRLALHQGFTREVVIGFIVYGVIFQGAIRQRTEQGYEYGQLALALLKRFDDQTLEAEVRFVFGYFVQSWREPAFQTEQNWWQAYQVGLSTGDVFHTACAAAAMVQSQWMRGVAFSQLHQSLDQFEPVLQRLGTIEPLRALQSIRQAMKNLTGQTFSADTFASDGFEPTAFESALPQFGSPHFALYYYVNQMAAYVHQGAWDAAKQASIRALDYLDASQGMLHWAEWHFYQAIIEGQQGASTGVKRWQARLRVRRLQRRFHHWADAVPENFLARARLIDGVAAQMVGQTMQAFQAYEASFELAASYGQLSIQTLAAQMLENLSRQHHLVSMHEYYQTCLHRSRSLWLGQSEAKSDKTPQLSDADFLLAFSRDLTQTKQVTRLLDIMLGNLIQASGARQGALLLPDRQGWRVAAHAQPNEDRPNAREMTTFPDIPLQEAVFVNEALVQTVIRRQEPVIVADAQTNPVFGGDANIRARHARAMLGWPLHLHDRLIAVIYLENDLLPAVFGQPQRALIEQLSGHMAIALDNAMLYARMEKQIDERTREAEQKSTQLAKAISELDRLTVTDPLTGLYNRRPLAGTWQAWLKSRSSRACGVVMVDIDWFKAYNDTYGHQQGDACLRQVADILACSVGQSETETGLPDGVGLVARMGGEEFVVLFKETEVDALEQWAQRLQQTLAHTKLTHSASRFGQVTISLGGVITAQSDVWEALSEADKRLYQAKSQGRNRFIMGLSPDRAE
ncbi:diguanylate cyclase [Thiomicrospira sp. WB1]|uniref:diguanylate cyclase n=1 Tax=Thiomicrospira sp. WB1 TaxID=1685380 RepID=UPI000A44ADD1|nr:diguanylate cyclase [Thiomicrospira sp. WB1]